MSGFAERTGIDSLAEGFDWRSVSTVVDVGGGWGEVCIGLAERFENLSLTVQDVQHVIQGRPPCQSDNVRNRVKYVEHDYFSDQNIRGADVYYFRYIFHNLPDDCCVKLLQAQIPGRMTDSSCEWPADHVFLALRLGAHIIIQDAVIPDPRDNLPHHKEKYRRYVSLFHFRSG